MLQYSLLTRTLQRADIDLNSSAVFFNHRSGSGPCLLCCRSAKININIMPQFDNGLFIITHLTKRAVVHNLFLRQLADKFIATAPTWKRTLVLIFHLVITCFSSAHLISSSAALLAQSVLLGCERAASSSLLTDHCSR